MRQSTFFAILGVGASLTGMARAAMCAPLAKFEPAAGKVYHGASLPDTWDENGLRRQIQSYNALAGKKLSVVTWFASAYETGRMTTWRQSYAPSLARVKRAGALSLIKFSTQDYAFDRTRRAADLKQIALGAWDDYFKDAAQTVRDFKDPVFISIDHEMNGNWYPYSQAYPGSNFTAADFVAAWRRIVTVFRQNGASNAAFVWSPNVPDVGNVPYSKYYPGDDAVDWIGVSFYSGNDLGAMDAIYKTYAAKKPFFITEWATAPEKSRYNPNFPGDVAWIEQFFAALSARYPRVKAISWFNWNKGDGNYLLGRVPAQSKAYAEDIANARYLDQPLIVGSAGAANAPETPRLDRPAPEIRLREIVPIEAARIERAPLVTPRRERLKLQVVPLSR
ncbi:Glycosyl hydrolase family 26 [Abditibacterium utsteinense]|uniref:Glycosyl hydrolase family 26 n=1 Tax=Abditibacterium utsteinense TaxID=1960156 RepID=A0A2S8SPD0_9BACT|nr:glycosyl hydrolase [Abditibacterium utsteinense]PQV62648.1 Glycosyl hydrolase family 26 [Abditibacterium utsteinense]